MVIEPLRFQSQLIGLGIFRAEARILGSQDWGRQTRSPAALLEALAPARVRHDVVVEVELRPDRRIEDVPGLAVRHRREVAIERLAERPGNSRSRPRRVWLAWDRVEGRKWRACGLPALRPVRERVQIALAALEVGLDIGVAPAGREADLVGQLEVGVDEGREVLVLDIIV